MPNHLTNETSPYLLQHVDNPVDWYPWGDEALELAKSQDKPILLSIGYAACHWCHVMAHESFEDPTTAAIMNKHFVNIKVDREERPDLDSIYMNAVVLLNNGNGGWPMTVFLTPKGEPFYGGTYYPPTPRYGMPSFIQLLEGINNYWVNRRDELQENIDQLSQHLQRNMLLERPGSSLNPNIFDRALEVLLERFDNQKGGFGGAPKFPPSMTIEFLLRIYQQRQDSMALHMAEHTLKLMAYGGIYDQLGGGFARYATDVNWLIPHFEKMLYDNALLSRVYLHAWQITGNPLYRRIVEETLDFVIREMRQDEGGFYSSYDADSEGEEGKFYVWSADEIRQALGADADLFMNYYDVSDKGNWEGHNILNMPNDPETVAKQNGRSLADVEAIITKAKQTLYDIRKERIWPGLDDKILTAWNGLMLAPFAEAGRALNRPDYTDIAVQNATFLYDNMRSENGRLLRTWKAGHTAKYNAYLEDYAYLADGLLALYHTTFDKRWFAWAQELADLTITHFRDERNGGFYDTSDDHEQLIQRPKDVQDNATPSANAMAASVLTRLSLYTGNGRYWDIAEKAVSALAPMMTQYPTGFAHWLTNTTFMLGTPQEVAIVGPDAASLINATFADYRPNLVVAAGTEDDGDVIPLLAERPLRNEQATAYVCRRFVCQQPVNSADDLRKQLAQS